MKTDKLRLSAIFSFLFLMSLTAVAANPFSELDNRKDVDVVYVSKTLLRSAMAAPGIGAAQRYIGDDIKNVESIYVINSEKGPGIEACKKAVKEFCKTTPGIELIMSSTDDGERTEMYSVPSEQNGKISTLLIYQCEKNEVSIVLIQGTLSLQQN